MWSLTETAAISRHGHEGPQTSSDDTVWSTQRRLLKGARVLVQERVHAVGGGRSAISHDGLWNNNKTHTHSISIITWIDLYSHKCEAVNTSLKLLLDYLRLHRGQREATAIKGNQQLSTNWRCLDSHPYLSLPIMLSDAGKATPAELFTFNQKVSQSLQRCCYGNV